MTISAMQKGSWIAIVALSGLLSGCAVLTVDVDVYKGNLVNEEHVQLHQLVALATAAKPMLVQLRDSIEWPSEEMPSEWTVTPPDPPKWSEGKTWYKPGYIPPPPLQVPPKKGFWCKRANYFCSDNTKEYSFFQKSLAVRVNLVLGLYEELDSDGKIIETKVDDKYAKGLDRLTKIYGEFSRAADHQKVEDNEKSQAEHRLIDALVEFSAKVLFLANHEGLASPPETSGLFLGGAERLNRGLFGDFITDHSMYALFNSGLAETKKQQYVRVLQAVGNSILFSANELRERERHRAAGKDKVKDEVAAVNLSYSFEPRTILDNLLLELQDEKKNADKKLDEEKARESILTVKIGSSTPPLTGLRADKKTAKEVLETTKQTFATYKDNNKKLKAVHEVLTNKAVENIKFQWASEGKEAADSLSIFLKGSDGLTGKIANTLTARQNTSSSEEIQRFTDADEYLKDTKTEQSFQARRAQDGHTSMKRADLLDNFVEHIHQLEKSREDKEAKYDQNRDQQDKKHNQIETEIAKLMGDLEEVQALLLQLPKDAAAFENARTVIAGVKSDVLGELEKHDQFASPSAVYLLIATHLSKREAAETETMKKQQLKDAQTVLSKRTPPAGLPPLDPNAYQNPIAVMDTLIALLRHRHIYAVDRYGKGSEEDKNATEALESAYQHRAGMIYIRPSSAYLRTSFPSTSLQDDPNLAWDNMLLQQGIRNLPFSSELRDILDPSIRRDRLLTSELDKQYWQNINRVRVSGTGFTNQVVAKDDVGNWYVKQYYGDTEDFIKSAKNLALFNLGMKLPIDLAGELKALENPLDNTSSGAAADKSPTSTKPKGDTKAETGAGAPPLNRVLEKHRKAYHAKTTEALTKLQEMHVKDGKNTIHDQIVIAWGEVSEIKGNTDSMVALKDALDVEIREWDKAAEALKSKSDQDHGQLIVKDLRNLSKLEKSLSVKIQEIDKKGSKPREKLESLEKALAPIKDIEDETKRLSELKTKATAEVRRVVGPLVLDILKDRKQTLDSYEQAIMFIGDATNPKDSSQK